ncbi:MAG: S8 family serine peptidase [Desulfobacterales bacterium]|nr:S8 family serine peptidase [Desulfobacterales bacterium]
MSRYPRLVLLLFLCISALPIAIQAEQTAPATNVKKGPDWIISEINPLQKTATRGQEALFDIQMANLTRSRYQRVEVSLIPAVSGRQGWFEIKPFQVQNIKPQQGFRVRVSITPTSGAPPGMHTFYTTIGIPGCPRYIIKEGPQLQVSRTKEKTSVQSIVPREVLIAVRAKKGDLQSLLDQLRRSYRLEVTEVAELTSLGKSLIRLRIPDDRTVEEVMEAFSRDPYKISPQPNYLYRTSGTNADPLRDLQYAFKALNADRLPSGINGKGVKIALLDTGVDYLHPDLKGRIAQKKDIVGNGAFCRDLHGTALDGIIAACCGNSVGVCGLAPRAEIISIKACRPIAEGKITATTSSFWLSQGLDYAILHKVRVINLSLGGPKDPLIVELVQEAFSRGIVIVAAAGDKGLINYPPYPAALPEVIAVAAVDIKGNPYTEGIQGDFIDLCAPGVDIMTTAPGDKYNCYTGTSMAAAYVTAAAALLLQQHPHLKPQQVQSLLEQSARDLGAPGKDKQFGRGLIDLKKLL